MHLRAKYTKIFLLQALMAFTLSCASKKSVAPVSQTPKGNIATSAKKGDVPAEVKVKYYFLEACREKIKGNIEIAENLFKECLKLDPNNAAANYELANLYRYAGFNNEAIKFAKVAATADPKNEWYNLLYIDCLHSKRLYSEAAARYEIMLAASPYRADFYQGLASEYTYADKPEKALQTYTRMEQKLGSSPEITLHKINFYKQTRRYDDAVKELKRLIADDPLEIRYYTYLAELYQDMGQPQKAFETYTTALKADSTNPYVHLALADYYRMQKKDDEFYSEIKTAFKSPDLDIDNKVKILLSYYNITEQKNKFLDQAYELCKILVDSNPTEPKAHSVYADFLYRDGKLKEARNELIKVIQFDKSKYMVWNQLLVCESDLGENDSLAKHSAEAMDLFPNQPATYFFNGIAYMRLRQYQKAIKPFKEGKQFVFENIPLQVQFASNLGEVYNNLKEFEKSDAEFEEALTLDPNNALVMNNYAYYLSLRKEKLAKAEKYSKRSLDNDPNNVSYLDTYGWILFQQGRYEEAKPFFERAIDKGGDQRAAITEHYGDVLIKLNEVDKAVEYWKRSKELGNKSAVIEKKIASKKYLEQ